jgi:hypothetical protein
MTLTTKKVQAQNFQKSLFILMATPCFMYFYFKLIFDINILQLLKNN